MEQLRYLEIKLEENINKFKLTFREYMIYSINAFLEIIHMLI